MWLLHNKRGKKGSRKGERNRIDTEWKYGNRERERKEQYKEV